MSASDAAIRSVQDIRASGAAWVTEVELGWLCDEALRAADLEEAIVEAMTSLATGPMKDGYAYSVLEEATADADAAKVLHYWRSDRHEPTWPINLEGRMLNLIAALEAYSIWKTDNRIGDKSGPTLDEAAADKWNGLDLNEIETNICRAVESIDLLTGRDTERVIDYTLGRIGEPDG